MKLSMKKLMRKIANNSRDEGYISTLLQDTYFAKSWVKIVSNKEVSGYANSHTKYMLFIGKEKDGMIVLFKIKEEV